jgi:SAM-dependent methyltransferase
VSVPDAGVDTPAGSPGSDPAPELDLAAGLGEAGAAGDAPLAGIALTRETPAAGVVVWQPRRGYRYGVEVYALAAFALAGGVPETAIDLGCGSGVIALLLASRGVRVRAVDRDPRWLALARRNAAESKLAVTVEGGDVRAYAGPPADLVVTNPPWFPADEPVSPDVWKAASRSMLHGGVGDFVAAGLRLAPRVCVVTRVERAGDLVAGGRGSLAAGGNPVARGPGEVASVWHVARRARLGARVLLAEVRAGEGPTVDEPLDLAAVYAAFGR